MPRWSGSPAASNTRGDLPCAHQRPGPRSPTGPPPTSTALSADSSPSCAASPSQAHGDPHQPTRWWSGPGRRPGVFAARRPGSSRSSTRARPGHDLPAAIIALLLAAGLGVAMLAVASPFALQLVRHWDLGGGGERQCAARAPDLPVLDGGALVCGLQVLSTLLFVFNADRDVGDVRRRDVRPSGALNANAYAAFRRYTRSWRSSSRRPGWRSAASTTRARIIRSPPPSTACCQPTRRSPRRCCTCQFNFFIRLEGGRHHLVLRQPVLRKADTVAERGQRAGAGRAIALFYATPGRRDPARCLALETAGRRVVERARGRPRPRSPPSSPRSPRVSPSMSLYITSIPITTAVLHPARARIRLSGLPALHPAVRRRRQPGLAASWCARDVRHRPSLATLAPVSARLAASPRAGFVLFMLVASVMVLPLQPDPARMMPAAGPGSFLVARTPAPCSPPAAGADRPGARHRFPAFEAMGLDGGCAGSPRLRRQAGDPSISGPTGCRYCANNA